MILIPTSLIDQKFQTNPKVVLEIKIGKGFISAPMPILLEDISFVGHMRVKLKLIPAFPHIELVELSFLEKPIFDYVLKPLGGETFGFDINSIPGLATFVQDQVHANLGPMVSPTFLPFAASVLGRILT
jgi:Ca2+-dependent lipid-binding protein